MNYNDPNYISEDKLVSPLVLEYTQNHLDEFCEMCNILFYSVQITLVCFTYANGNPIIIRSAVVNSQGQQENLQRYGTVRNKGDIIYCTYFKKL